MFSEEANSTRFEGMAATVGEEEIVEGRNRVTNDKDAHPTKRAQLEDCRRLGDKAGAGGGGEEREEEDEPKEKVDRLRGLLEDDPKKLENKDVEDMIRYLDVNDIISLALKPDEGKESEQCWVAEVEKWMEEKGDCEKVANIVRSMMCCIGLVRRADFKLLHEKLFPKVFTTLLLAAVDSANIWNSEAGVPVALVKADDRSTIHKLCCVLPWKLFAHVLVAKSWVPELDDESDEEEKVEEECTPV